LKANLIFLFMISYNPQYTNSRSLSPHNDFLQEEFINGRIEVFEVEDNFFNVLISDRESSQSNEKKQRTKSPIEENDRPSPSEQMRARIDKTNARLEELEHENMRLQNLLLGRDRELQSQLELLESLNQEVTRLEDFSSESLKCEKKYRALEVENKMLRKTLCAMTKNKPLEVCRCPQCGIFLFDLKHSKLNIDQGCSFVQSLCNTAYSSKATEEAGDRPEEEKIEWCLTSRLSENVTIGAAEDRLVLSEVLYVSPLFCSSCLMEIGFQFLFCAVEASLVQSMLKNMFFVQKFAIAPINDVNDQNLQEKITGETPETPL